MTTQTEAGRVLIAGSASELAFKAGQILQRELVNRAVALAESQRGTQRSVLVTVEHIKASLSASLVDKIRSRLGVGSDGESGE